MFWFFAIQICFPINQQSSEMSTYQQMIDSQTPISSPTTTLLMCPFHAHWWNLDSVFMLSCTRNSLPPLRGIKCHPSVDAFTNPRIPTGCEAASAPQRPSTFLHAPPSGQIMMSFLCIRLDSFHSSFRRHRPEDGFGFGGAGVFVGYLASTFLSLGLFSSFLLCWIIPPQGRSNCRHR